MTQIAEVTNSESGSLIVAVNGLHRPQFYEIKTEKTFKVGARIWVDIDFRTRDQMHRPIVKLSDCK